MADSPGDPATSTVHTARPLHSLSYLQKTLLLLAPGPHAAKRRSRAALVAMVATIVTGCGVQGPPRPPRVQIPRQITDLRAVQTGRTLHITFTMPALAIDGEQLTKPVQIDIFRAISAPGKKPAPPDTSAAPWLALTSRELPHYLHAGEVDYPFQISPQDFRRRQGSSFAFAIIAFTRGFRGHHRKSAPSNVAQATLVDVTKPVTNLELKATQTALRLSWAKPVETLTGLPPAHLSGYRVYQSSTGKPDSFQLLGKTSSTHFDDKSFQFGKQYYFQVSAITSVNGTLAESEPSAPVSITPRDVFPPPVPAGLTAVNAAGAVDLLWNASHASDLAGYNVYRSTNGGPFERINKKPVPTPIFHDTSVAPGTRYQYAITAIDLSGNESDKSPPATITTPGSARR